MFFFAVFLACYFLGRWSESCKLLIQPKCSQQVHILLQFVLYWLRWRMLQFELVGLNVRSVFSVTGGFKCDSCSTKSVTLYSRFVWSELNWIFTIAYSVWTSTRFIQNLSITANLRRTRDNVIEKKKIPPTIWQRCMKFRAYGNIGVRVVNKPENICVGFYQSDAGVLAEIFHGEGTT